MTGVGRKARAFIGVALLFGALGAAGCGKKKEGEPADAVKGDKDPGVSLAEQGTYLHVVVPSVIRQNTETAVRLRVLTFAGLPNYEFEGGFRVESSAAGTTFPKELALEPQQEGYYEMKGILFGDLGVQRLRGLVPKDTVQALANPFVVQANPEWNVYWGDLHGSSDLSTGARAPSIYYWYARNVALLDFVALTDAERDEAANKTLDEKAVIESFRLVAENDQSGRFVAIPGFEWTSAAHGDRVALFSEIPTSLPTHASGVDTPEKLRAALPAGSLLLVPHPSGSDSEPAVPPASVGAAGEDLVEVCSSLGVFEAAGSTRPAPKETPGSFAQDLLAKDWHPGFIAASDTRLTMPGNPRGPGGGSSRWPIGLTAVVAKELSRASVLEALREGRTYGTTGARYLLEFTVDGSMMGSEVRVKKGHRAAVYGSLGSTTNWVKVEIVAPGGVLATLVPEGYDRDVVELKAETAPVDAPTWVYLRGTDEFGGMAWSSPVYLRPE